MSEFVESFVDKDSRVKRRAFYEYCADNHHEVYAAIVVHETKTTLLLDNGTRWSLKTKRLLNKTNGYAFRRILSLSEVKELSAKLRGEKRTIKQEVLKQKIHKLNEQIATLQKELDELSNTGDTNE